MDEAQLQKALRYLLTWLFILLAIVDLYLIYTVWPAEQGTELKAHILFIGEVCIAQERQFLLLVIFAGALGGIIHMLSSYSAFIGNRTFEPSWVVWYLFRPLVGAGLALLFYVLIRGGILSYNPTSQNTATETGQVKKDSPISTVLKDSTKAADSIKTAIKAGKINVSKNTDTAKTFDSIMAIVSKSLTASRPPAGGLPQPEKPKPTPVPLNPFGIMAIAALAGLFSNDASKKLEEVFKALFNVKDNDKDTLTGENKSKDDGEKKIIDGGVG